MNKSEFSDLFREKIAEAIRIAGPHTDGPLPTRRKYELHGCGHGGEVMSEAALIEEIYISADEFYRVIDVAIGAVVDDVWLVFVRVSDHPPGKFSETWNTPEGSGPFKVLEPAASISRS